jgi:hypothetical protein
VLCLQTDLRCNGIFGELLRDTGDADCKARSRRCCLPPCRLPNEGYVPAEAAGKSPRRRPSYSTLNKRSCAGETTCRAAVVEFHRKRLQRSCGAIRQGEGCRPEQRPVYPHCGTLNARVHSPQLTVRWDMSNLEFPWGALGTAAARDQRLHQPVRICLVKVCFLLLGGGAAHVQCVAPQESRPASDSPGQGRR